MTTAIRDRGDQLFAELRKGKDASTAAVRALIAEGCDVQQTDPDGRTPLHLASSGLQPKTIAEFLCEAGANPNAAGAYGRSPLHVAANNGEVEIVRLLLRYGADPNIADECGRTPGHLAGYWRKGKRAGGHHDVIEAIAEWRRSQK